MTDRKKVGLALGGGAARGLAHLGVLEVLEREIKESGKDHLPARVRVRIGEEAGDLRFGRGGRSRGGRCCRFINSSDTTFHLASGCICVCQSGFSTDDQ